MYFVEYEARSTRSTVIHGESERDVLRIARETVLDKPVSSFVRLVLFVVFSGFVILYSPIPPDILSMIVPLFFSIFVAYLPAYLLRESLTENAMNIIYLLTSIVVLFFITKVLLRTQNLHRLTAYLDCLRVPAQCLTNIPNTESSAFTAEVSKDSVLFNGVYALMILLIGGFTKSWTVFSTWLTSDHSEEYSIVKHYVRLLLPNAILYGEYDGEHTLFREVRWRTVDNLLLWAKWTVTITLLLPPLLLVVDLAITGFSRESTFYAELTMAAVLSQSVIILVVDMLTPYKSPPWLTYTISEEN
ncbi:hypothetical protein [Halorubrum saccharovorum]|uniref:hypothetical protein n=1 Tax=Halorubrum saccharovorum TaxID=2248 RepID=UPI00126808D4|nr:hypothetical protein [Halorubrum saccharovorum]